MLRYLYYIRYFSFIALNWNLRLAFFTMYHEVRGERKYSLDTSRLDTLRGLTITGDNLSEAQMYQGASYFLLENIFRKLSEFYRGSHFVDMGCGKGRALVVAAHHGFQKLTGVDFAEELCKEAVENCKLVARKYPGLQYQIIHSDSAAYAFASDADVIYFFNPFDHRVMRRVVDNLLRSIQARPRTMYIMYINPQLKSIFLTAGFTEVYYIKKMDYADGCILKKSP